MGVVTSSGIDITKTEQLSSQSEFIFVIPVTTDSIGFPARLKVLQALAFELLFNENPH